MVSNNQRLRRIALPDDANEAQAIIKETLFGAVAPFSTQGREVISASSSAPCHTYAVIDALQRSDIAVLLEAYETEWSCLWKGDSAERFAFHAPYLVLLEPESDFTQWLLTEGWGKNWGIFLRSYLPLPVVSHHLRKFNQVYDEVQARWLMFRYYAPNTVKTLLPFLPAQTFIEFTDGLTRVIAEDLDGRQIVII
ncbi:DUF4123 domain-containing protein [Serratia sp. ASV30]|uniref:DUF4123 domain-containing protein n=1 Tax=Serratia sp. ASV30 TaxID=2795127 RepID=UPI0018ED2751|nr:DUF4123 domain-containing protein [Serratia sp. ASV30]